MSPRVSFPVGRIVALPTDVLSGLRVLPQIADHTEAMKEHTAVLRDIADGMKAVSADTEVLPAVQRDMSRVAALTGVLEPMDERMAAIQDAMPTLVVVQQHLARVPDTLERLDGHISELSLLLERLVANTEALAKSVDSLYQAVGPLGRLAQRLPGRADRNRSESSAEDA
jgi:hypothetical protein